MPLPLLEVLHPEAPKCRPMCSMTLKWCTNHNEIVRNRWKSLKNALGPTKPWKSIPGIWNHPEPCLAAQTFIELFLQFARAAFQLSDRMTLCMRHITQCLCQRRSWSPSVWVTTSQQSNAFFGWGRILMFFFFFFFFFFWVVFPYIKMVFVSFDFKSSWCYPLAALPLPLA